MERREHDQGGKGNPYEDPDIKDTEDCGIIVSMKTLENEALMRIYRKDLTLSLSKHRRGYLYLEVLITYTKLNKDCFST